jgi:hypothetical protein
MVRYAYRDKKVVGMRVLVSLVAEFKRMVDNDVDRREEDADESILSGAEHREWGRFWLTAAGQAVVR